MKEDSDSAGHVANLEGFTEFRAGQAAAGVFSGGDAAFTGFVVKPGKFKGFATPDKVGGLDVKSADGAVFEEFLSC